MKQLQNFGGLLYDCLLAYRDEYPTPFEHHYTYIKLTEAAEEEMETEDFKLLSEDLQMKLRDQDIVGSLSLHQGFFSGLLVTDPYSNDKLEDWRKSLLEDKGARSTLLVKDASWDVVEVALQEAWTKADDYLLFE